jgi:hypothetical protein
MSKSALHKLGAVAERAGLDAEQLHLKIQRGIWWNLTHPLAPIRQVWRHYQLPLAPHSHAPHPLRTHKPAVIMTVLT